VRLRGLSKCIDFKKKSILPPIESDELKIKHLVGPTPPAVKTN